MTTALSFQNHKNIFRRQVAALKENLLKGKRTVAQRKNNSVAKNYNELKVYCFVPKARELLLG